MISTVLKISKCHKGHYRSPIVIGGNVDSSEAVNKGILEVDMVHNVSVDTS